VNDYDAILEPQAGQPPIEPLPGALFYWLAQTAQKAAHWSDAEIYYTRFLKNPDNTDLVWGAWWNLGKVQSQRKEWAAAVSSYQQCYDHNPKSSMGEPTTVLLALGRAQLGAQNFDAARALANQALLQEPEGPNSAAARMLLGETAFATHDYPEAARMFATLAVLFDDPQITPQAIARAADSFEKAGDAKSATDWRQKLKDKYPQYQPVPYL
jgi:TolA-binding protein